MDSTFLPVHNTRLIAGIVDDGLSGFSSLLYQLLLLLHNLHDLLKLLCVQLLNRGVLVACKDTYTWQFRDRTGAAFCVFVWDFFFLFYCGYKRNSPDKQHWSTEACVFTTKQRAQFRLFAHPSRTKYHQIDDGLESQDHVTWPVKRLSAVCGSFLRNNCIYIPLFNSAVGRGLSTKAPGVRGAHLAALCGWGFDWSQQVPCCPGCWWHVQLSANWCYCSGWRVSSLWWDFHLDCQHFKILKSVVLSQILRFRTENCATIQQLQEDKADEVRSGEVGSNYSKQVISETTDTTIISPFSGCFISSKNPESKSSEIKNHLLTRDSSALISTPLYPPPFFCKNKFTICTGIIYFSALGILSVLYLTVSSRSQVWESVALAAQSLPPLQLQTVVVLPLSPWRVSVDPRLFVPHFLQQKQPCALIV